MSSKKKKTGKKKKSADAAPAEPERTIEQSAALTKDLAEQAMDPTNVTDVEQAIGELSQQEAEMFLTLLEAALKKRKILLFGYITALLCLVLGTMFALYMYGSREDGEFVAWAWLVPFCGCGITLWAFGRWAKRQ
jgi:hypothetical protein